MEQDQTLHSRRSITLKFDIPISKTHEFWGALRAGRFVTTKCKKCGQVTFPPQADCPKCMSDEFEWTDIGPDAVLVTYTYVHVAPASFARNDPYAIAIGEFAGGLKILAWLEGVPLENARVGMKLKVEERTSKEGNPYYVFIPA